LRRISRALISVSDKTGVVDLARALANFGVEILSTGATARALMGAGVAVREVSDFTGFPEILGGRVKTLHPLIHGGILVIRDNREHQEQARQHNISYIDLVVVNLYPFRQTVASPGVTAEDAIENIDIGGPAMIRSAAKNFNDVAVVVDPADYPDIIEELNRNGGAISAETRFRLAQRAFQHTAGYDLAISEFLVNRMKREGERLIIRPEEDMPARLSYLLTKAQDLRYGENPHQRAALYLSDKDDSGVATAEKLQGKELSYNNLVDLDAAWALVRELSETACAIIKHTNPCGAATAQSALEAYQKALATDPVSAFGGIIAFNSRVDESAAQAIAEIFTEAIIAPDFTDGALSVFSRKKNLRLLRASLPEGAGKALDIKRISGGILIQDRDLLRLDRSQLKVVTRREPSEEEIRALLFAWTVCKHVKSNAIVYAREGQLVGVGAGQMSRVDSVKIGAMKARLALKGTVLASDAFFPFRDGLDEAAKHGITAVIQPGGSVRDEEVIAAADEHGLAMVFTNVRHFKH